MKDQADLIEPGLYMVATPIGSLEDLSFHALRVLRQCDWIAAEDTRETKKLLTAYDVATATVSLHQHSGERKVSELVEKLNEKDKELQLNVRKVKILQQEGGTNRQVSLYTNNVMRCREYIDNVTPIAGDLNKLIQFADAAYEESGIMLEDARLDLEAKKDLYYSVTTGLSAVNSAMKAFRGDEELNKDAEKALALLKIRIGEKIGHIKSAIDVTSRFMDDQVLEDKAKSAEAVELINRFDLGKDFHYAASVPAGEDKGRLKDVSTERYRNLLD